MAHVTQLELGVGARPAAADPPREAPRRHAEPAVAMDEASLLARLNALGLRGIETLRFTRNRTVMVSFRGHELRVNAAYATAPDDVLRAVATFVSGRGAARRAARRALLVYPVHESGPQRRRERTHPADAGFVERLRAAHADLNASRFGGTLRAIDIRVSRRMRSRLGHYAPAPIESALGAEIVISRRHIRRHGWRQAVETLLHEMVHQWQDDTGLPLDHGTAFRRKAREVGISPSASRAPD